MTEQICQSVVLAEKIAKRVQDLLAPLEREMAVMQWPTEFQKIIWTVVADEARARADECK